MPCLHFLSFHRFSKRADVLYTMNYTAYNAARFVGGP